MHAVSSTRESKGAVLGVGFTACAGADLGWLPFFASPFLEAGAGSRGRITEKTWDGKGERDGWMGQDEARVDW